MENLEQLQSSKLTLASILVMSSELRMENLEQL